MDLETECRASLNEALLAQLRSSEGKPFTHIIEKIRSLWGTKTCDMYLNSLMITDRIEREGFPPEVSKVIMSLLIANELFMRRTTGIREFDTISGHDWAGETGGWTIKKAPETKPDPKPGDKGEE